MHARTHARTLAFTYVLNLHEVLCTLQGVRFHRDSRGTSIRLRRVTIIIMLEEILLVASRVKVYALYMCIFSRERGRIKFEWKIYKKKCKTKRNIEE